MNKRIYVFIILMFLYFLCLPLTGLAGEVKDATHTETETHLPFLQANLITPAYSQNQTNLEQNDYSLLLLAASEQSCLNTCGSFKNDLSECGRQQMW